MAGALGVSAADSSAAPRRCQRGLGAESHGRFRPPAAGAEWFEARPARLEDCAVAAGLLRFDWIAADAGRSRSVLSRRFPHGVRASGRSAAPIATLRRTLGAALARSGPLCRNQQLRTGQRQAQRLAIPGLRHPFDERRQAVRPVPPRAVGGRRVAGADGRFLDRDRVLSLGDLGRRAG